MRDRLELGVIGVTQLFCILFVGGFLAPTSRAFLFPEIGVSLNPSTDLFFFPSCTMLAERPEAVPEIAHSVHHMGHR